MSTKRRDKTLSYHRAEFFIQNPSSISLSSCIIESANRLKTANARSVLRSNGQFIRLAREKVDEHKGILIHLTVDTPGETTSVVPQLDSTTREIEVSTAIAPERSEYMDGDAFLYVRGNDVCACTTTMHLSSIEFFLREFFDAAQIRRDAGKFTLMNALDDAKIALMHKHGVSEVELRGIMYSATSDYIKRKNEVVGVLSVISKHVKAFLGKEHDVTQDGLKVILSIKADNRLTGAALGRKRLEKIGENLINKQESNDDYAIKLKNGEEIRPGEIFVRTQVEIDSKGKSVDRDDAWDKLISYYDDLRGTGVLSK